MSRIFITGDLHGNALGELRRFSSKRFKEGRELTKNDYIIVVGDFGLLFDQSHNISKEERYNLNWLSGKPWTTLFIDGNHENFDRLDILPTIEMFGSPAGKVNDSVFHLRRGYVYNISGISFFTFGGGQSIDKAQRMPHVSWWNRELPNYIEMKRGIENLEKVENNIDFIIAHECPTSIIKQMHSHHVEPYQLTEYLQKIVDENEFVSYFFGHHHNDVIIEEKFVCLYNKIIEITEVNE